ncbi:MAG: DUF1295 domain-containing protein [Bacteroidales bacterium]|nr:DUF1295 domain-containing protein [Bacteroidales bacterium]
MVICLFFCLLGFGIRIYIVGHTPKNTSGRNTSGQLADELNTTGVYSVVRHPLYLGNFFMWLGMAVITLKFDFWLVAFLLSLLTYLFLKLARKQIKFLRVES